MEFKVLNFVLDLFLPFQFQEHWHPKNFHSLLPSFSIFPVVWPAARI
uniref:Uncharacterized protein LOC8264959 n=1 Tax=Rhizophora mucronata TaxID=61149 RepID=A0A2P2MRH3_RHIMU